MTKLATFLSIFACLLIAHPANGEEASEPAVEEKEPEAEAPAAEAEGEAADGPVDYAQQSRELLEKMAQLKKLIAAKGDKINPAELEKIKNLEKVLGSLTDGPKQEADPEVVEFFATCVLLSMRKAGQQKGSTMRDMRKMAKKQFTPEEASKSDLWLYATSCITRLTDAELSKYKSGNLKTLPNEHAAAAKTPEMAQEVIKLEAGHWEMFETVALSLTKDEEEPPAPANPWMGAVAAIPLLGVFAILGMKFKDMTQEKEDKKKKKDKDGKKGK